MDDAHDDYAVSSGEKAQNIGVTWDYRVVERKMGEYSEYDIVQYWGDNNITPAVLQFYTSYDSLSRHYAMMQKAFSSPVIVLTKEDKL